MASIVVRSEKGEIGCEYLETMMFARVVSPVIIWPIKKGRSQIKCIVYIGVNYSSLVVSGWAASAPRT